MQGRWLKSWSPAPLLQPSHFQYRRSHSAPHPRPKAPKRNPVKVVQHYAKVADVQHAAQTSLSPFAAPIANLSRSLLHFQPYLDNNFVTLKKRIDFNNPKHAQAWQELLQKGWVPLQSQGNLYRLLKHDHLLFNMLKLTAAQLREWPRDTPEASDAWRRFESIIRVLVAQRNRDGSTTCSPRYLDTIIADWIWSGFANEPTRSKHALYVVKLWRHLLSIQKPPPNIKVTQIYNLRLSQRVHNGIVAAASISSIDLPTFIRQYAASTSLHSLRDSSLSTGSLDDHTRSMLDQHFSKEQRALARTWIQQVDLALNWARGGSTALHQRIRRWADRRDGPLIERHLDALLKACNPATPEQSWIDLIWSDDAGGQDALATIEDEEVDSETEDAIGTSTHRPFEQTLQITPALFGSLIISLLRLDQVHRVEQLWQTLQEWGLQPTPSIWHALLAGQMRRGDSKGAQAVIENMAAAGIELSPMVHLDEARALFRAGEIPAGMAKVSWMMQTFDPLGPEVYKRLFHVMIRRGLSSQALNLLQSVPRDQIDISVLNPFITWFCRKDHSDSGFHEALDMLHQYKIDPDGVTYTILLNGALDSGRHAEAAQLVSEMHSKEGLEGTRAYGSVLTHLAQSGSAQLLQQALQLLRMLERSNPQALNEIVYTSIVQALCQQSDLRPGPGALKSQNQEPNLPFHLQEAHAVVERMKLRGVPVTGHVYNALITGHMSRGTQTSAFRALKVLQDMREANKIKVGRDFVDPATWRALIYGLMRAEEWQLARQVVGEMEKLSFQPQGALAQAVKRVKEHET